jgi:hypothetical protein
MAAALLVVFGTAPVYAQQGTAADAKAMLDKTMTALKADKAKTLEQINAASNGFLVGDIYPFCFQLSDGKIVAVASNNAKPNLGKDIRTLKDGTGKVYGPDLFAAAQKGSGEVSYMFPKPGADAKPAQKISILGKAGDLGCGVGYYK